MTRMIRIESHRTTFWWSKYESKENQYIFRIKLLRSKYGGLFLTLIFLTLNFLNTDYNEIFVFLTLLWILGLK